MFERQFGVKQIAQWIEEIGVAQELEDSPKRYTYILWQRPNEGPIRRATANGTTSVHPSTSVSIP